MPYTKEALHYAEVNVSETLESYRIPDSYIWRFSTNGKLISQYSDEPVENVIVKDNPLGKIEYDAFLKIQDKAFTMDSGYIIWISPIHPIYYPETSKIIISEKKEGILSNKSINTNWDKVDCILVARELAKLSSMDPNTFKTSTDIRANPIFIDKENSSNLRFSLKKIIDTDSIKMMETGIDIKAKQYYMNSYLEGKPVELGQDPRSCPIPMRQTAFRVFAGEDEYGSLQFECPHCHKTNNRAPHQLISNCQHCTRNVEC